MIQLKRQEVYKILTRLQPSKEKTKTFREEFDEMTAEEIELFQGMYRTKDKERIFQMLKKFWNVK